MIGGGCVKNRCLPAQSSHSQSRYHRYIIPHRIDRHLLNPFQVSAFSKTQTDYQNLIRFFAAYSNTISSPSSSENVRRLNQLFLWSLIWCHTLHPSPDGTRNLIILQPLIWSSKILSHLLHPSQSIEYPSSDHLIVSICLQGKQVFVRELCQLIEYPPSDNRIRYSPSVSSLYVN